MNPVYFHLLTNYVPVMGTIASVLLITFALIRRSRDVAFAGLGALILAALITIPVYLAGQSSEEIVEDLPGFSHERIEEHEGAAEYALIAMEVAGGIALLTLILSIRSPQPRRRLLSVVLIFALFALSVTGRTAYLGGKIRHTEVHGGTAVTHDD
jgi:hypothetical protein